MTVKTDNIIKNIDRLHEILKQRGACISLTTKLLCGNKRVLQKLVTPEIISKVHSFADSRLSSIKKIKKINSDAKTMYIKPPARNLIKSIVEFADISMNSSFSTIKSLDEEARRQEKVHEIIIMIEMGELREGILRENIVDFYENIFELENIKVIGIGTNLGCMYGIEPTFDKLIQLTLYKELLEAKFNKSIDLISGGSSITLPLMDKGKMPPKVNHFRIGEAIFFGVSPLENKRFDNLSEDTFEFEANVIELEKKSSVPDGTVSDASIGHISKNNTKGDSYRAIVDYGILDVDYKHLKPKDKEVKFFGTTSDMTVYDIGDNKTPKGGRKYIVHSRLKFKPDYMAVARLMNSKFIDKNVQ